MEQISRGHPGVIRADIPAQNFGQGAQNPGKNKHLGADIHEPKARTSTTLSDFQKFSQKHFGLNFRSLVIITMPITPKNFWRFNTCNFNEKAHLLVLSLLGKDYTIFDTKNSQEFIGVIHVSAVTPESSWGICFCVILEGPMLGVSGPATGVICPFWAESCK